MQKIATRISVCSSIAFGIIGILLVLTAQPGKDSPLTITIMKLLFTTAFIILPYFAPSIAGKYLNGK